MVAETEKLLTKYQIQRGIVIEISVPGGKELARRTFNPKLGITGGISIIGTSGVVRPFSSEAFVAAIRKEIQVAKALGCRHIVINSGAKSEKVLKELFPDFLPQAFIHYGNYIEDGTPLDAYVEVTWKDDGRGDPLITKEGLDALNIMTPAQFDAIVAETKQICTIIKDIIQKRLRPL